MMYRDFLLEIGTEEIPARFMPGILKECEQRTINWLSQLHIEYKEIATYGTPRRIVICIKDLCDRQQDQIVENRGPSKAAAYDDSGNLTKAGLGFARGQGVTPDQLELRASSSGEYIYAVKKVIGGNTVDILHSIKDVILHVPFPKNMRWGNHELRFVRPIQWLLCMYGNQVIPFSIANRETSNVTYGHRFLSNGQLIIDDPASYFEVLQNHYVIVDQNQRKNEIINEVKRIEKENNVCVPIDDELLEEITYLVEYPTAIMGSFDTDFLQIPSEVLITSMKEHQRYFPVMDKHNNIKAHFVTIKNGDKRAIETIRKGNEKVLRARLADARFFYEEDKKIALDTFNAKLASIVYQEELGTIADKLLRVKRISEEISKYIVFSTEETQKLSRIIEICKFDLVTNIVYEFPELQGLMGREYALLAGESPEVAEGILEHYLPRFAGDEIPKSRVGSIASISEKIDTIVSCFGIGIIPTGSQDPYALRRQAAGICQIIKGNQLELPLDTLIDVSLTVNESKGLLKKPKETLRSEIFEFFMLRVKNILQEDGIRYDCIDASIGTKDSNLLDMISRGHALQNALANHSFNGIVESYNRVKNIASKLEDSTNYTENLFIEPIEMELHERYIDCKLEIETAIQVRNFTGAIKSIEDIKPIIDKYFDNVMVMDKDISIKNNRLAFLNELYITFALIGDLSKILNK